MKHQIDFVCSKCDTHYNHESTGMGTGYGKLRDSDDKVCYKCLREIELEDMVREGHNVMYLTGVDRGIYNPKKGGYEPEITNWPGTLTFPILNWWTGDHNWATTRYHVVFYGPSGELWYGDSYGAYTEVCHCYRYANQGS